MWGFAFTAASILVTSFLSGIFGMLGGLILMGLLLMILPVSSAMALHAVTQMASNGWRAFLWRNYIMSGLLQGYLIGALLVFGVFSLTTFALPKTWVFFFLGLVPFIALAVPIKWAPNIQKKGSPFFLGIIVMALQLLSGVSGAVLDIFFVRSTLDRRQIVASKAMTQTLSHFLKLGYFTLIVPKPADVAGLPLPAYIGAIALAMTGTFLSRRVLEKLTDHSFQQWSRVFALAIGALYLIQALQGIQNNSY